MDGDTHRPRPGCIRRVATIVGLLTGSILVLCLVGGLFQTVATYIDRNSHTPRGTFYSVNGHAMHIVCMGTGSPAVILEAGGAANSLWWYRVQDTLAQHVQVCAYDRAGQGWSEPAEGPRDAIILAEDLHTLLNEAAVPSPWVMVGHSYGAIWARVFAARYADEVAGLVLVDSTFLDPPRFPDEATFRSWKAGIDALKVLEWATYRTGIVRLTAPAAYLRSGYPPEIARQIAALQARNLTFDTDYAEQIAARLQLTEASAQAQNLGAIPMIVLWAGSSPTAQPFFAALRSETEGYSSDSLAITVEGADHGSILGGPIYAEEVSRAILEAIKKAN